MASGRGVWRRVVLTAAAGALLSLNAGCLFVAAGAAAAGGAAAGYAYLRGQLYRDYPVSLDESHKAVLAALAELQLPVDKDEPTKDGFTVQSRTGDGRTITIDLEAHVAPVPVEGVTTRVAVRVGTMGDETVSTRLLDQIDLHLVTPATQPAVPAPGSPTARLRPVSAETSAPPLAPPAPPVPVTPSR